MSVLPFHLPSGVHWIDTQRALAETLPKLRDSSELAIDTEADSYYAYHVKVCLLQLSTRTEDFLLDPLAGLDFAELNELFADRRVLKVFHAGSNDVALLRRRHRCEFVNVFDTMIAAQVLGLRRPGLASLLQERFGVEQKKTFQTSDWSKRPLTTGQLQYAAVDTHWLLPLKDQLESELGAKRRLDEAAEEFQRLPSVDHADREFDPEAFRRAPGAAALDAVALRVLHDLYLLRDQIASRRDRSPHRVFPDHALVAIARARPARRDHLFSVDGCPRWQLEREADAILETVAAAAAKGPLVPERRGRRGTFEGEAPLSELEKRVFEALRRWRSDRARQRDVEESRVATTGTLRAVARAGELTVARLEQVAGMSPFRVREYGDEIVQVVAASRERRDRGGAPSDGNS